VDTILFFRGVNNIQQVYRIFKGLVDIKSKWKDVQFNAYGDYFNCSIVYDKSECINEYPQISTIMSLMKESPNYEFMENNSEVIKSKLIQNEQNNKINILLIDDQADDVYKNDFTDERYEYNFILKKSLIELKSMDIKKLSEVDFILLDISFVESNHHQHIKDSEGFEILNYLRDLKQTKYLPIVMFSDYNWEEDLDDIIDYCWRKGSIGFYKKDKIKGKLRSFIKTIAHYEGEEIIISISEKDNNIEKELLKRLFQYFQNKYANIVCIRRTPQKRLIIKLKYFEDEEVGSLYRQFKRNNKIPIENKNVKFHLAELYEKMNSIR